MEDWTSVVKSVDMGIAVQNIQKFSYKWSSTHCAAVDYIERTWIPHKSKFFACFANVHMHLYSSSTSSVEGNHHILKNYIQVSSVDLLTCFERIQMMLKNQLVE